MSHPSDCGARGLPRILTYTPNLSVRKYAPVLGAVWSRPRTSSPRLAGPWLTLMFCFFFVMGPSAAFSQVTTMRLPLPVDSPGAVAFESPAPLAAVLTGVLWPAAGPLVAWAPVYSSLQADGSLKEVQAGVWVGPRPDRWLKVVKPGFVVGGFRVLVKTGPGSVQTRQVQVFWKPWSGGEASGRVVESRVYGAAAGPNDTVKILELQVPEGAVPTGLYGQIQGGQVVQASLIVRLAQGPPTVPSAEPSPVSTPRGPRAPTVELLAPDLRGISQEQR